MLDINSVHNHTEGKGFQKVFSIALTENRSRDIQCIYSQIETYIPIYALNSLNRQEVCRGQECTASLYLDCGASLSISQSTNVNQETKYVAYIGVRVCTHESFALFLPSLHLLSVTLLACGF